MRDELEREDLGLCVGCNHALRVGEVVTPWDDEVGHYNCGNPASLERIPALDNDPDCPPPFVLLGNPARYVALDVVRAALSDLPADEIARLRAENEALRETLDDAMTKLDAPDPDLKPLRDFAIGVLWAIKEAAHTRTALKGSHHE